MLSMPRLVSKVTASSAAVVLGAALLVVGVATAPQAQAATASTQTATPSTSTPTTDPNAAQLLTDTDGATTGEATATSLYITGSTDAGPKDPCSAPADFEVSAVGDAKTLSFHASISAAPAWPDQCRRSDYPNLYNTTDPGFQVLIEGFNIPTGTLGNNGDVYLDWGQTKDKTLKAVYPTDRWTKVTVMARRKTGDNPGDWTMTPVATWIPGAGSFDIDETAGGNPSENCAQSCSGDPVNEVTGDFFEGTIDLELAGVGPTLSAARTYSAHNAARDEIFGHGWGDPLSMRIEPSSKLPAYVVSTAAGGDSGSGQSSGGTVTRPWTMQDNPPLVDVVQETGARNTFLVMGNGQMAGSDRALLQVLRSPEGTFSAVRRGKTNFYFDAHGYLTRIADPNGNAITVSREADRAVKATNASGRTLTYSYDASGHVSSVTDNAGRSATFTYDTAGNLTASTAADGGTSTYAYDDQHRMISRTKPGGINVANVYDGEGRVTKQTEKFSDTTSRVTAFTYSAAPGDDGETTITNAAGMVTKTRYSAGQVYARTTAFDTSAEATWVYRYSPTQTLDEVINPLGSSTKTTADVNGNITSTTDPAGRTLLYYYDANNNPKRTSTTSGTDLASAAFDADSNPLTVTDANGATTTNTFNTDGSLATTTDALGHKTTFAYAANGDLTSMTAATGAVTKFGYDAAGRNTTITSPTGRVTTTSYDSLDRPTKVTDAAAGVTTYSWTAAGQLASTTDPLGRVRKATYALTGEQLTATDALGKVTTYGYNTVGQLTTLTDANNKTTTLTYDIVGNLATTRDPLNRTTTYGYDLAGQQTSVKLPSGATTTAAYNADGTTAKVTDALGRATTYGYDAFGRQNSVNDPLGRTTGVTYDNQGNVLWTTAADGTRSLRSYDAVGNLTSSFIEDGANYTTTYTYDAGNRRTSATVPGAGKTAYTWTAENQLLNTTTAAGSGSTNTYDALGRLTKIDYTGATPDVTYAYDKAGQRTSMVDGTGTTSYTYDKNGNVLTQTAPAGKTTYTWTALNQPATLTYPDLRKVTNTYDAAGQLTKMSVPTGAATGSTAPTGTTAVAAFGYTPDGYLTSSTGGNLSGSTTTMVAGDFTTVDVAGQTTAISVNTTTAAGAKTGTAFTSYAYSYDAAGQLSAQTITGGVDTSRSYGFSSRGQLNQLTNTATTTGTGSATTSQAGAFSNDRIGNLTATADGTTLTYGARWTTNEGLLTTRTPRAGPATTYAYDANGNRVQASTTAAAPAATSSTTYGYNAADTLTSVTTPATVVAYTVNGDGQRVTRAATPTGSSTASSSEKYVWDNTPSVPVMLADGTSDYLYGPNFTPIAQINRTSGAITWLHHDLTGSVTTLTSSTGTVTGRAAYSPYGTLETSTGTVSRFGYAGEYTDPDTGLLHLRARDYDPATGQFITLDPALGLTEQPYSYAGGNPLQNTDPLGLFSIGGAAKWVGGGFVAGLINFSNGASGGSALGVADWISPGASCTINTTSFGAQASYWAGFAAMMYVTGGKSLSFSTGSRAAGSTGLVNLADDAATQHILYGDVTGGGGHLWPGLPGKSAFPKNWSPDVVMHHISDIATDPALTWIQQTGRPGAELTKNGRPVRFIVNGVRDNVEISVIIEKVRGIITGFPTGGPR